MFVVATLCAVAMAAVLLNNAVRKMSGGPRLAAVRARLGVNAVIWKAVGVLEVLGATGVLLGLLADLAVVGVLAAAGVVLLTAGAVVYHRGAGDPLPAWLPAIVVGLAAVLYVVARIVSA